MKGSGLLGLRRDFEIRPNLAGKGTGGRGGLRARALGSDLVGGDTGGRGGLHEFSTPSVQYLKPRVGCPSNLADTGTGGRVGLCLCVHEGRSVLFYCSCHLKFFQGSRSLLNRAGGLAVEEGWCGSSFPMR